MHIACKRTLYKLGWYQFRPPPAHCAGWSEDDWIQHISACNDVGDLKAFIRNHLIP